MFRRTVFTRSERTEDELDYIKSVLSSNVLFQDMAAIEGRWSQRILNDLAAAFYKVEYKEGDVIFAQGDPDKDFMLILEQGECQITIGGKEIVSSLTSMGMLWLYMCHNHNTLAWYMLTIHRGRVPSMRRYSIFMYILMKEFFSIPCSHGFNVQGR